MHTASVINELIIGESVILFILVLLTSICCYIAIHEIREPELSIHRVETLVLPSVFSMASIGCITALVFDSLHILRVLGLM